MICRDWGRNCVLFQINYVRIFIDRLREIMKILVRIANILAKIETGYILNMSYTLLLLLTVTQLVNKFPVFYGTQRFTIFTRAHFAPHPEPDPSNPHLSTLFS